MGLTQVVPGGANEADEFEDDRSPSKMSQPSLSEGEGEEEDVTETRPSPGCSFCCCLGVKVPVWGWNLNLILPSDRNMAIKPYLGVIKGSPKETAAKLKVELEKENSHDFLFLQNDEREERYRVESEHALLPVGNVIKLLEQKRSSQDCLHFIPYFLTYLIFTWSFFATSECHEQYQVLRTATARLALLTGDAAGFQGTTDVEGTNRWIKEKLPLLGAEVNKSLACTELSYVAANSMCSQSYRCDAQINYVLAIGRPNRCEPVKFERLPEGAQLAGDHVGKFTTLATLVIRSPTAWLAVHYSAQKTHFGLNNRTLPKTTYSGLAAGDRGLIPFAFFLILFCHRIYLISSVFLADMSLVLRFMRTAEMSRQEKKSNSKSRKTCTNDADKRTFSNLEQRCQTDYETYTAKMYFQLQQMCFDHGLEVFSILINIISFYGMFFDYTFENVQGVMVMNLLLLILMVFKFGGSVFTPFKVIKMTFVTALKDIGNFVISLFVIIAIFVVGARTMYGVTSSAFSPMQWFGVFEVFDHVLNTYSRAQDTQPLFSNLYYFVAATMFILLLSQFVIAVIVGAFDEARAQIESEDQSSAIEPGFVLCQEPPLAILPILRSFFLPSTLVWSDSLMTVKDLSVLLRDHVDTGAMAFEKLVVLLGQMCLQTQRTLDDKYALMEIPLDTLIQCEDPSSVKMVYVQFLEAAKQWKLLQDHKDKKKMRQAYLDKLPRPLCIEVFTIREMPIDPDPDHLHTVINSSAGRTAYRKQLHAYHLSVKEKGAPRSSTDTAIQRVIDTVYDMNFAAFRQQCRKDSVRLAKYIFSQYAAIPLSFYKYPGQFVEYFHTYRIFSHDDRLRLPSNTRFATFGLGRSCRECLDSPEFDLHGTKGKSLLEVVPDNNLIVRQTKTPFQEFRSFDMENSKHIFVKATFEGEEPDTISDLCVSNSPNGPFFSVDFGPQAPATGQKPTAKVNFSIAKFEVTGVEDRTVSFRDDDGCTISFDSSHIDKMLPNDFLIHSSESDPLPGPLKVLQDQMVLTDSLKHNNKTGDLSKIEEYIIQPGRSYLYMTSIDENGAVLRLNANEDNEAYPVSWCSFQGRPASFTESLSSEMAFSALTNDEERGNEDQPTEDSNEDEETAVENQQSFQLSRSVSRRKTDGSRLIDEDDLVDQLDQITDQTLLGQQALTIIQHQLEKDESNCHLFPTCIAHDFKGCYHDETSPLAFEFTLLEVGHDGNTIEGLVRLDLGLRDSAMKGRSVFFKNPFYTGYRFAHAQMHMFRESFSKFDNLTGEKGQVKAPELKAIMDDLGMEMNLEEISKLMASVDHDGNGFLNFPEFVKLLKTTAQKQFFLTGDSFEYFSYNGFAKINLKEVRNKAGDETTAADPTEQLLKLQATMNLLLSR